jgi:hypothetical protein
MSFAHIDSAHLTHDSSCASGEVMTSSGSTVSILRALGDAIAATAPPEKRRPEIDERAWPRLVVRWPAGALEDDAVATALDALLAIAARPVVHTVLVDLRDAWKPTHSQLGMIIEAARLAGPRSHAVAVAIVARSSIVRATVDSIRWMHMTGARWASFDDVAPATEWLDNALARASDTSASRPVDRPRADTPPAL